MNKKLYGENGYLDFNYVMKMSKRNKCPFIIMIGARGTGKTFGALKYVITNKMQFMYMRRTQTQLDIIRKKEYSPFISLNEYLGLNLEQFTISKYSSSVYDSKVNDKGLTVPKGDLLGLTAALSTFSNVRSFDASYIKILIYDEFIGENHERPIKEEAAALFNAIETINRNRELTGSDPLYVVMLANSNNISNPYFLSMNLVSVADRMIKTGQEIYFNHDKGLMLLNLSNSPISKLKAETALYKLTAGSDFFDMAINNDYIGVCRDAIESQDLKEYKLSLVVGELAIYKHKTYRKWYITTHISGTPRKIYSTSINSLREFRTKNRDLWLQYTVNRITFENYTLQVLFEKYYKGVI